MKILIVSSDCFSDVAEYGGRACNFLVEHPEFPGRGSSVAMNREKPFIITNCCSLPEVVDQGSCGLTVEAADVDSFRNAISDMLSSPEKVAETDRAGRQRIVEYYTWRRVARLCLEQNEKASE